MPTLGVSPRIIGVAVVVLSVLLILERLGAPALAVSRQGFDAATLRGIGDAA